MNQYKTKIFTILMGSILATGLQGMAPQPQSWAEYIASLFWTDRGIKLDAAQSEEQKRKEAEERLEQENVAEYRQEAIRLRDIIFDEYKRSELSSIGGKNHADVESIDIHVVNPNNDLLEKSEAATRLAKSEHQKSLSLSHDPNNDPNVTRLFHAAYLAHAMERAVKEIKEGSLGVALVLRICPEKPIVVFDGTKPLANPYICETVFHELAHALDVGRRKPETKHDITFYSWLKDDVKNYSLQEVSLWEWHADKQAISWLKKYKPDQAKKLMELFEYRESVGFTNPFAPHYPPYLVMLAWLRDPNV